jgi:hypothetical protein
MITKNEARLAVLFAGIHLSNRVNLLKAIALS